MIIEGRELQVNLIELAMEDFDLILGMDMLAKYGATINCKKRIVTFAYEGEIPFVFMGSVLVSRVPSISTLKAKELLQQGCTRYLAYAVDTVRTRAEQKIWKTD